MFVLKKVFGSKQATEVKSTIRVRGLDAEIRVCTKSEAFEASESWEKEDGKKRVLRTCDGDFKDRTKFAAVSPDIRLQHGTIGGLSFQQQ